MDPDAGNNGRIKYTLRSLSGNSILDLPFDIRQDGEIYTLEEFYRLASYQTQYAFEVLVEDYGTPKQSSVATVYVSITC